MVVNWLPLIGPIALRPSVFGSLPLTLSYILAYIVEKRYRQEDEKECFSIDLENLFAKKLLDFAPQPFRKIVLDLVFDLFSEAKRPILITQDD